MRAYKVFSSRRHFYRVVAKDARKFGVFSAIPGRRGSGLMQLTGENLTCERGGREVFRGLSFCPEAAKRCW